MTQMIMILVIIMEQEVIKRDFHGYKLGDAIAEMHVIIGEVRTEGGIQHAEIITGHGVIQTEILALCKYYGLDSRVSWSNSGVVNVTVE